MSNAGKACCKTDLGFVLCSSSLASPQNDIAAKDTERFCEVLQFVCTEEFVIV